MDYCEIFMLILSLCCCATEEVFFFAAEGLKVILGVWVEDVWLCICAAFSRVVIVVVILVFVGVNCFVGDGGGMVGFWFEERAVQTMVFICRIRTERFPWTICR